MNQRAERRAAGARTDREGQAEDADRGQPQHPADHHQHGILDRLEEFGRSIAALRHRSG